jgi:UNC80 N-terminal
MQIYVREESWNIFSHYKRLPFSLLISEIFLAYFFFYVTSQCTFFEAFSLINFIVQSSAIEAIEILESFQVVWKFEKYFYIEIYFCVLKKIRTMENNHGLDDGMHDLSRLPVPVQIFLWRQIAPFVRPKLGKLHEANCMVSIFRDFISEKNDRLHCNHHYAYKFHVSRELFLTQLYAKLIAHVCSYIREKKIIFIQQTEIFLSRTFHS